MAKNLQKYNFDVFFIIKVQSLKNDIKINSKF